MADSTKVKDYDNLFPDRAKTYGKISTEPPVEPRVEPRVETRVETRGMGSQVKHAKGFPGRVADVALDATNVIVRNAMPVVEYGMLAPEWTAQRLGPVGRVLKGGATGTYGSLVPLTTMSYALEGFRKNVEGKLGEIGEKHPRLLSEHIFESRDFLNSAERLARALNLSVNDPKLKKRMGEIVKKHLPSDLGWGVGFHAVQHAPQGMRAINKAIGQAGMGGKGYEHWLNRAENKGRQMRKKYWDTIASKKQELGNIPIGGLSKGRGAQAVTNKPTREAAKIWEEVTGVPVRFRSMIAQTPVNLGVAAMVNRFARFIPTQVGRELRTGVEQMWEMSSRALKAHAQKQGYAIPSEFIGKNNEPVMAQVAESLQKELKEGYGKIVAETSNLFDLMRGYVRDTRYYQHELPPEWFGEIFDAASDAAKYGGKTGKVGAKASQELETFSAKAMNEMINLRALPGAEEAFKQAGLWKNGAPLNRGNVTWEKLDNLRRTLGEMDLTSTAKGQRLQVLIANKQEYLLDEFIKNAVKRKNPAAVESLQHAKRHFKIAREEFRNVQKAKRSSLTRKAFAAEPFRSPDLFIKSMISGKLDPNTITMNRRAIITEGGREAWDKAKGMWWWSLVDDAAAVAGEKGARVEVDYNGALNAWNKIRNHKALREALFDRPGELAATEDLMIALGMAQSSGIAQLVSKGSFDAGALGTFGRVGMFAVSSLVLQGGWHASAVTAALPAMLVAAVRAMSSPGSAAVFSEGVKAAVLHSNGIRTPQVIQSITKMGVLVSPFLNEDEAEMRELDAATGLE